MLSVMLFYGVVSAQTEKVVEFFLEREAAEVISGRFGRTSRRWRKDLRVEAIELGYVPQHVPPS